MPCMCLTFHVQIILHAYAYIHVKCAHYAPTIITLTAHIHAHMYAHIPPTTGVAPPFYPRSLPRIFAHRMFITYAAFQVLK